MFKAFGKGLRTAPQGSGLTTQRKFETGRGIVSFSGTPGRVKLSANALVTTGLKVGDTVLIYGDDEATDSNKRLAIAFDPNGSKLTAITVGGKVKDGALFFHASGWGIGIRYNAKDVEPYSYDQLEKAGYIKRVDKKNGKYLGTKTVTYGIGEELEIEVEEGVVVKAFYLINPEARDSYERPSVRKQAVAEFSIKEEEDRTLFDDL
jgi:hypothetical protein